jgi:branched-chain amino acid transport system substrate-binding protein
MPGQPRNNVTAVAYGAAVAIAQVLRQSGDDLTRVNVMKQAANLKNLDVGMALPGIKVNTGPSDYTPFSEVQLIEFTGEYWKRTGPVIDTLAL